MQDKVSTLDCCANCGIAAVDEIKLKPCPHCDLVQYCSDKCLQDHLEIHQERCIERAVEMHDEILFKQPESSCYGDCPICFLPLPLDIDLTIYQNCCGNVFCAGCNCASTLCALKEGRERKCPFCRKIVPASEEESTKRKLRRVEANDPIALQQEGIRYYREEDYENAFRYYSRASGLGNDDAHFQLGLMYMQGEFVERDTAKGIALWKTAAISGHAEARFMLGQIEWGMKRFDRAVRHLTISASLGDHNSVQMLMKYYKEGHIGKDDFAKALRANQAAVDAMKSSDRETAEKILRGS